MITPQNEFTLMRFMKAVEAQAAKMRTQNLTLVAIGFVFLLLLEILEKRASLARQERGEYSGIFERWTGKK